MLEDSLGLPGYIIQDPREPWRPWTIQWIFSPITNRALGGVRAKLMDQQGFITFCNQRDLEVLLGYGIPGSRCPWTKEKYPSPEDREWVGFCVDHEDLLDDLYERELRLRNGSLEPLSRSLEITRLIHFEEKNDAQELLTLLWDADTKTGMSPDTRLETIEQRWVRVEKLPIEWG